MKILLCNGSPIKNGVINAAFDIIKQEFLNDDIITFNISNIKPCINCRKCKTSGKCCDKSIEKFSLLCKDADIIIFGSPVYYGGITAQMKSFLTKLFYSHPKVIQLKPIGTIVSSRRCGSLMALSELNAPFLMHSGIIVGSTYWNEVYGDNPNEMQYDYEGIQTLQNLASNLKFIAERLQGYSKVTYKSIKHLNFISREFLKLNSHEKD